MTWRPPKVSDSAGPPLCYWCMRPMKEEGNKVWCHCPPFKRAMEKLERDLKASND